MRAMVLRRAGEPLELTHIDVPRPVAGQILLKVSACGVCRTDLHVVDGELTEPKLPLVLGHQIVGTVVELGAGVKTELLGARVGVPWLGATCGACRYCRSGAENLCDEAGFTGYQLDGGYADYAVADQRFCFPILGDVSDAQAAPLLCAGLIGYRALRMCGAAERIGLYGFGAAAHIVAQIARFEGREVGAFTRPGDAAAKRFATDLGAAWAVDSTDPPPVELDGAIIFAPVGSLVVQALRAVRRGGVVVCAGIHMSDIPSFPYALLWGERSLRSVANLTRQDGDAFLPLAVQAGVRTQVTEYPLEAANEALADLRNGRLEGAAVLVP
jgi:propanol-preferring alcohol dehydrogenase